jgi:hypothetical protein
MYVYIQAAVKDLVHQAHWTLIEEFIRVSLINWLIIFWGVVLGI